MCHSAWGSYRITKLSFPHRSTVRAMVFPSLLLLVFHLVSFVNAPQFSLMCSVWANLYFYFINKFKEKNE